jgi:hypothetical protein
MREHQRRITDWLRRQGARRIRITGGGKHLKLNFLLGGASYRTPIANTPSDYRATRNALCDLRRRIVSRKGREAA